MMVSRSSKPPTEPVLLEPDFADVPTPAGSMEFHCRHGLCIEVALAVCGPPVTRLDEARAHAIERCRCASPGDAPRDVPGHDLRLGVGEDTGLRQRLPELQRDADKVAQRVHVLEPG